MNRSFLAIVSAVLTLIGSPLRAEPFVTRAVKAELVGQTLRFDLSAAPSPARSSPTSPRPKSNRTN
jgi:hypothetical protein